MEDQKELEKDSLIIKASYRDHTGIFVSGIVVNISMGGVFIETNNPLLLGDPLFLNLDAEELGKKIKIHGKVVRQIPEKGMAVEFINKDNQEMKNLIEMIKSIVNYSSNKDDNSGETAQSELKNIADMTNSNDIPQDKGVAVKEHKRRYSRKLLKIEARYQDRDGKVLKGTVRNISIGGVYIDTDKPLDLLAPVKLSLDAVELGKVIYVEGKVVRHVPYKGMAVEFREKENRDVQMLLSAMRKLDQASLLSLSRSGMDDE